jgi:hypothetical protein
VEAAVGSNRLPAGRVSYILCSVDYFTKNMDNKEVFLKSAVFFAKTYNFITVTTDINLAVQAYRSVFYLAESNS